MATKPTRTGEPRASSVPSARNRPRAEERPAPSPQYCSMPAVPERRLGAEVNPMRARAILENEFKWVNGTTLRYYFFDRESDGAHVLFADGTREWRPWRGAQAQQDVVRRAFAHWKAIGIGLDFKEVAAREEGEVRIGFMQDDGSWSYPGTYVLQIGPAERTMNFGWDLTRGEDGFDTALHEIGHAFGLPHEHQNPNAGIVWDEEAVYAALAEPPNRWTRDKTFHNIIRKLPPDSVQGSNWDPDSVMHYPFEAGLITAPERYRAGLRPRGGLSERDKAWVRTFYAPGDGQPLRELAPGRSEQLALRNGEQQDFEIRPDASRPYNLRTFGSCDTLMVLFAEQEGELRYQGGDDDSGEDRNASLRVRLTRGQRYVLRVRLKYSDLTSPPTVMMW
jgi:hypothetical protein